MWQAEKLTNKHTNWLYGAEPFLRSHHTLGYSRISEHFIEPRGLLPCSQEPSMSMISQREISFREDIFMHHQFNNTKHCNICQLLQEYFPRTSTVMSDFLTLLVSQKHIFVNAGAILGHSGAVYLWSRSTDWCVNGMPGSMPMGLLIMASTTSPRTIPGWVWFSNSHL
jgi:hypothetical protein